MGECLWVSGEEYERLRQSQSPPRVGSLSHNKWDLSIPGIWNEMICVKEKCYETGKTIFIIYL